MSIGERVRELRNALGMTQLQFADSVTMKRGSIASLEAGRPPSDQTIRIICAEFSVSEEWLRNGKGEMFIPEHDAIGDLIKELHLIPETRRMLEALAVMPPDGQKWLIQFMDAYAKGTTPLNSPPAKARPLWPPVDDAEALRQLHEADEAYRQVAG